MFGLARSLRKVGVRAYAEVRSAEQTPISVTIGNPNLLGNNEIHWHLQLRVLPEFEPPFDAAVHVLLPQINQPRPGTRVAVLYDPNGFRAQMMQRGAEMQQQAMTAMQAAEAQAAQAPPASNDPVDRLERLAALKDRGLITDDEFEQQKRRILGEI